MIIGLTETWITEDMYDGEIDIKGYAMYRCDRMHGGCIIYVHESLTTVPLPPVSDTLKWWGGLMP